MALKDHLNLCKSHLTAAFPSLSAPLGDGRSPVLGVSHGSPRGAVCGVLSLQGPPGLSLGFSHAVQGNLSKGLGVHRGCLPKEGTIFFFF